MTDNLITFFASAGSAIVGAIIGAVLTYFFNVRTEKLKMAYQKEEDDRKEAKETYRNRPRLEIQSFERIDQSIADGQADIDCAVLKFKPLFDDKGDPFFEYDKAALDENNYCYVECVLKNTGNTEIEDVYLTSRCKKTTSIVDFGERETFISWKILSYVAHSSKSYIKPGETISLRVRYLKGQILHTLLGAPIFIYLDDIEGNMWVQPFYCPLERIDNSRRILFKEYLDDTDTRSAIECFKNPEMW